MSFRTRMSLLAGVCVALAVALSAFVAYTAVREKLRGQIDSALQDRAYQMTQRGPDRRPFAPPGIFATGIVGQWVAPDGEVEPQYDPPLPLPPGITSLGTKHGERFFDVNVGTTPVRMLAVGTGGGYTVVVARDIAEVNQVLDWLGVAFFLIAGGGVAVAAVLGLLVGRAALRPVERLTAETESVRQTGDLSRRVETGGGAEFARLGTSFNAMLAALQVSRDQQRQLVSDASHELRTPLTSLRTNMELIDRLDELPPGGRERLVRDLRSELEELTALVADLTELAGDGSRRAEPELVQLDALVEDVIGRARRRAPGIDVHVELAPTLVRGVPAQLERAVANLLDNAVKWSPPGARVEVRVGGGEVEVRDHGPGIAPEDVPHIFDRFYRSASARGKPGSGLGLAIVRKVADEHGAIVEVEQPAGGGTLMRLRLPVVVTGEPALV